MFETSIIITIITMCYLLYFSWQDIRVNTVDRR